MTTVTLVAIAKNEERYLLEWIAYHLAIGYDKIMIYDNESSDNSVQVIKSLTGEYPVEVIAWPSIPRFSPQRSAYSDAVKRADAEGWITFLDIDEFIVPWGFDGIKDFFGAAPEDAASVAINWLGFGSSHYTDVNYASVVKTFTRCARHNWVNNRHFKTSARVGLIGEPHIHDLTVKSGRKLASDFSELKMSSEGRSLEPIYGGIQINHYQVKTWHEFSERMARGNANFPPGHPNHGRDGSRERFEGLDKNELHDDRIAKFMTAFDPIFARMLSLTKK
ncbi:glycosyltransferase family 2 protein [Rhizobium sp. TRM95796]|uniref:glycosyltransferase family 2 protein n=1 Tax=Rhizobium sp. TRM95796 TaxID=2979862 RepID=UPI0021E85637|nr:glycosyltransferase family 2 protein [Rhizobium sp. TRM95796]MCV3769073.1 glycosyltransferase family 2 protein [Rhizobium sp. TRM95796]